ncbi:MAG: histone deacetylase [Methylophaga sp.]|nr:MAG: histone deacetylase [Methylophaga sp.]
MKRRQILELSAKSILATLAISLASKSSAKPALKTGLVLDDAFVNHHISASHPESPARYHAIKQKIITNDLLAKTMPIVPKSDAEKWLGLIHSPQHINAIKTQQNVMHDNALLATAGVLAAVDAVCENQVENAFCASRPPGHHARNTGQEEGFCYYNHIAIAAKYAQQQYERKRILIVDWDYHHGDGTEWAFYSDPSVLYFSTHDMFAYPRTGFPSRIGEGKGEGFNINVHLNCGSGDEDIIEAFINKLLPAAEQFQPDLILISAGFDSRQDDLLGCFDISDKGFMLLTNMIKILAATHCQGNIVSMLEGGYNLQGNASAVMAHITTLANLN